MFKRVDNQDMIQQKLSDGSVKRYVKGRLLGKGGFAKCYEVISLQTEKKYAAKIIEKASLEKSKAKQKLTSQIKIHKSLHHPFVVHFEHYFEDAEFVYILLEKCPNQTLNELLKRRKRLTDVETKYYIRQLAVAIKYIHQESIIHRDLKLGNLFLSDKLEIKIGDFGLATKLSHVGERKKTKCGTPNYIAPEILDDKKTHSSEVDIWSMGVITYALLVGRPPFETNDVKDTYNKIKQCNYGFPQSANIADNAKNFVAKMLQLDPSKRATAEELLDDPFLYEASIPALLPLSSLACPPSFDFLKKYRDIESEQSRSKSTIQNLDKSQALKQETRKLNSTASMEKFQPKFTSRINSVQKNIKLPNRVSSATNLLINNNTKSQAKFKKQKNEFVNKCLKIWVSYYEQNPKFGLAYMLNSSAAGFKFNDYSAMIGNCGMTQFKYIEYDSVTKKLNEAESKVYKRDEAEHQQPKKYKILTHFYRDLVKTKTESEAQLPTETKIKIEEAKHRESPQTSLKFYVSRYHRTNKGIIFWFNIGAMQMIFQDGSQILVSEHKIFTYVNKYWQFYYFEEKDMDTQPEEVKKRLSHLFSVVRNSLIKKQQNCQNKAVYKSEKPSDSQSMSRCSSSKFGSLANSSVNGAKNMKASVSNKSLATADKVNKVGR